MMKCSHCGSERKNSNSLLNHERTCKSNINRVISSGNKGRSTWSKGKTKETDPIVAKIAASNKGRKQKPFTEEAKERLRQSAIRRGLGGYRPHPNRGIRYKGIWFDSKWEVKVAQSLDEHGIVWERPKTGFVWNETGNKYYPDFYLQGYGVYLDPKNEYLMRKDKDKIEGAQVRNDIKVILLNEHELDWVAIVQLIEHRIGTSETKV